MTSIMKNAMSEHRRDLADVAAALAANCSKLLVHEGKVIGNVIDGGTLWVSEYTIYVDSEVSDREDATVLERVDEILASNLLTHLAEEFPEMAGIGDWREVTRDDLSDAIVGVLSIVARRRMFAGDCDICRSLVQDEPMPDAGIRTQDVVDNLMEHKKHKRVKEGTIGTYRKHLRRFEREFPWLPTELPVVMKYLDQFDGSTGRAKRNQQDIINMLYRNAVRFFGLATNPMDGLERPIVTKKPIKTLSLDQVPGMLETPETPVEEVALDMMLGHGWRQVEVRRILVGDVDDIKDGLIWCRGKVREEWAPVLPETLKRLKVLAKGRDPTEGLLLSDRIRSGRRQPFGEDGMAQLVARLYARAGITGMTGHDFRRTFGTLVSVSCGQVLAMRLLRDTIPGVGPRYVDFPMAELRQILIENSPISKVDFDPLSPVYVDGGEPRFEANGGDGGESKSPVISRRGEYRSRAATRYDIGVL